MVFFQNVLIEKPPSLRWSICERCLKIQTNFSWSPKMTLCLLQYYKRDLLYFSFVRNISIRALCLL